MEKVHGWEPRRRAGRSQLGVSRVVLVCLVAAAVALSVCGSGASKSSSTTTPTTGVNTPVDKTLGNGVSATSIKMGIALGELRADRAVH